MKRLIFFIIVFLLVIPIVKGQDCSPACQPDYESGVCRGTIITSPYPAKTVTWADGTSETIQVGDKGEIYLNGEEVKAFGFDYHWWGGVSPTVLETALAWQQQRGVRFVDINIMTPKWIDMSKEKLDLYMPKFYEHKMFISLILKLGRGTNVAWWNPTVQNTWKSNFDTLIDYIDSNGWSDMVFTVQVTHEMGEQAWKDGKTVQELSDLLDLTYNHASTKLASSQIGSVPITHQVVTWANSTEVGLRDYWKKVLEKTDVIYYTFYPNNLDRMNLNFLENNVLTSQVGKDRSDGYVSWYEFGRHVSGTRPTYVPVDHFTTLLGQTNTAFTSLFFAFEIYDSDPEIPTWYFDTNGNPESWTQDLAPYFPQYETACLSGEVPIATGCPSGEICCCSEEAPIPTQCETLFDRVNKSMGSRCRRPGYDKIADVDKDGRVDLDDQFLVLINFGDEAWCEDRLNDRTNPCRGGCPILKVFDGEKFVTVEKLDIHAPKDQDTIATSTFTMELINGKYEIVLDEAAYLFWDGSHIDSVKLVDEEGKECQLISAEHSKQGNVLQALAESDDIRVRTFPGERIKLIYDGCSGKEFTFSIEGYNMKLLGLEIPDFLIVLLTIIILFVIFAVMKFFVKK